MFKAKQVPNGTNPSSALSSNSHREQQLQLFNKFVATAWGTNPSPFIKISRTVPTNTHILTLGSAVKGQSPNILVPQEYEDLYVALGKDILVVTGQPGVDLEPLNFLYVSVYSIYILIRRLEEKQPVALQFPNGLPLYALFHDKEAAFHSLDNKDALYTPDTVVWTLCDSNNDVRRPPGLFKGRRDQVRIIRITSPKEERWKQWKKQHDARLYVMDIWTTHEVRGLA
ncbi:hypothetical protein JVU11DRAFT_3874 [Chiua virens]|nr:hypothetical protein JVU11DRAFT_3874 [Chiua virens]